MSPGWVSSADNRVGEKPTAKSIANAGATVIFIGEYCYPIMCRKFVTCDCAQLIKLRHDARPVVAPYPNKIRDIASLFRRSSTPSERYPFAPPRSVAGGFSPAIQARVNRAEFLSR